MKVRRRGIVARDARTIPHVSNAPAENVVVDEEKARAEMEAAKKWLAGLSSKDLLTPALFSDTELDKVCTRCFTTIVSPCRVLSSALFKLFEHLRLTRAQMCTAFKSAAPFPHLSIPSFMDASFCHKLLEEVKTIDYVQKDNDLYQFSQSDDLKTIKTPLISKLKGA